jgi:hypothetical protein
MEAVDDEVASVGGEDFAEASKTILRGALQL